MDTTRWQGWSDSPARTRALGCAVARCCQPGDLLALVGELGAGKTQLVRGLAEGLGADPDEVSSPTFVLLHEYEIGAPARTGITVLRHVDAYRLTSADEGVTIGWDPRSAGQELRAEAVLVVEWADRVRQGWGEDWLMLKLDHEGDDRRRVTAEWSGHWQARADALCHELEEWSRK